MKSIVVGKYRNARFGFEMINELVYNNYDIGDGSVNSFL